MKKINLQFGLITIFVLLAAFSRTLPHIWNFSPICAMGLFGAAHYDKQWKALLIPLSATWLSDLFINNVLFKQFFPAFTWFYDGFYWQYGTYLLIGVVGYFLFNHKITVAKVLGGSLIATVLFFLISNFGVWAGSAMYAHNFSGLLECYAAGLPFLKGTLGGNLFYSTVFFGGYYLLQKQFTALRLPYLHYA
jgi:hypothetical protein